jgi:transposase
VPTIWVLPPYAREVRAVIAHCTRLVRMRTMANNRLQSRLHRHNLHPPPGKRFAPTQRAWWRHLDVPLAERLCVEQDRATLDQLAPPVATLDRELHRLSTRVPWAEQVPDLLQLPGIGVVTAMTVLGAEWRKYALPKCEAVGRVCKPRGGRACAWRHRSQGADHQGGPA